LAYIVVCDRKKGAMHEISKWLAYDITIKGCLKKALVTNEIASMCVCTTNENVENECKLKKWTHGWNPICKKDIVDDVRGDNGIYTYIHT
jgi:hypothetical protein